MITYQKENIMGKFKLSEEQETAVNCRSDFININAFAGTGKTTTLLNYALMYPKQSFLYICYNKSIQQHAEKIFPSNVKVKTSHSLAYGYVGHHYRHKLKPFITSQNIMDALDSRIKVKDTVTFTDLIIKTLEKFCFSEERVISENHLPMDVINTVLPLKQIEAGKLSVIKYSNYIFGRMMDINHGMPITHDVYMKIFQLHMDSFHLNFDTIMLDEAQDANPVLLDIIKNLNAKKIFVGDSYQSIYNYRGAANALKNSEATNLYLTNSFRFGSNVANFANILLTLSGELQEVKGHGHTTINSTTNINRNEKRVVLFRNNAAVIDKMFNDNDDRIRYYLEGGMESYGFFEIDELIKLRSGKRSNHHLFKHFEDLDQVKEQAEILDNRPLVSKCNLIDKIKTSKEFNRIKNRIVVSNKEATIGLSNTHKVKGNEFEVVELYNDFSGPMNPNFSLKNDLKDPEIIHHVTPEFQEETNIAYVALTRVKSKLYIPNDWLSWMSDLTKFINSGSRSSLQATAEAKKLVDNKLQLKKNNNNNLKNPKI